MYVCMYVCLQNFCSYTNFPSVWVATRRGRKKMAVKWLQRLREGHPDLAASADLLNERDGAVAAPPCAPDLT